MIQPTAPERPDERHRRRIVESLDETLFVEAGAGSGKTRALVDRIAALVTAERTPLDAIAAITFTEKAAAELRDRVRRELERRRSDASDAGRWDAAKVCDAALEALDAAAIGTLHSFAQRILIEHPIEAGLPPRVEVLDEVASAVAFDHRWARFVDELLAEPTVERALLLATSAGVRPEALRTIAVQFNQNWDLVAERGPSTPIEPPAWTDRLDGLLAELSTACDEIDHCLDDTDRMYLALCELAEWAQQVQAVDDEYTRLWLLSTDNGRPTGRVGRTGAPAKWSTPAVLHGLRDRVPVITEQLDELRNEVALAAVTRLAVDLRRFTLAAAEERRAAGELEFHDLLVMARQVLRDPTHGPAVRGALHRRYRYLLVDEFQDTDPIQVDLAVLIASPDAAAGELPWHQIDTRPGHLFFVGDPKQSIYRFRRADISLFLRAAERFGEGGRHLSLTTNFRSGAALIDAVNDVFGHLITPQSHDGAPSQPAYEPFVAVRSDAATGPALSVLGRDEHADKPKAGELRTREAAELARAVRRILDEGWAVDRSPDWQRPDWQPARAGDITVLIPTRTSLPALEDALSEAGISYRTESASLVYASRLVRDLLLALRAVDDPTDELSVVAALRSPLFACGDDDLLDFRRRGGRFNYLRRPADDVPDHHIVARGLAYLRDEHDARRFVAPSELLDRLVRDRRVLELGEAEGRPRDLWRRVRFVVDQARAWCETTDGTLRQYLEWIGQQTAEGSRVAEAVLPETDDDAVRIMTIHAAKGLQFPITVVSGLSTRPQKRPAAADVVWPPDGPCLIRVGRKVTSADFEAWRPIDEQISHDERIRLLYVAATRARDHLVVSLHRSARANGQSDATKLTSAELLAQALITTGVLDRTPDAVAPDTDAPDADAPGADGRATGASGAGGPARSPIGPPTRPLDRRVGDDGAATTSEPPVPGFDDWKDELDQALARSSRPRTVAATALAADGQPDTANDAGLRKRSRDLDLPPWQKGRYGTAVGRAVHGALQTIDLATGAGAAAAVAAQAAAEGVIGFERHLRALVDAALRSPTVVEAAAHTHWRELYVGVPLDGERTLEGYVDLLYRRSDGLVVVDYKTGPTDPADDLDPLVERYRLQGGSYALAVAAATGEPVAAVVFVFLTPGGPVDRPLPDLAAAVADARHAAEAGREPVAALG